MTYAFFDRIKRIFGSINGDRILSILLILLILLSCYPVILLSCYPVILLSCYPVILLSCYPVEKYFRFSI